MHSVCFWLTLQWSTTHRAIEHLKTLWMQRRKCILFLMQTRQSEAKRKKKKTKKPKRKNRLDLVAWCDCCKIFFICSVHCLRCVIIKFRAFRFAAIQFYFDFLNNNLVPHRCIVIDCCAIELAYWWNNNIKYYIQ